MHVGRLVVLIIASCIGILGSGVFWLLLYLDTWIKGRTELFKEAIDSANNPAATMDPEDEAR